MTSKRNLTDVMATLYTHEINCGCESFWDAGFNVWLGDGQYNGIVAETTFWPKSKFSGPDDPDFADAGDWLWEQAVKEHPAIFGAA
jgi:hypothetical protein